MVMSKSRLTLLQQGSNPSLAKFVLKNDLLTLRRCKKKMHKQCCEQCTTKHRVVLLQQGYECVRVVAQPVRSEVCAKNLQDQKLKLQIGTFENLQEADLGFAKMEYEQCFRAAFPEPEM